MHSQRSACRFNAGPNAHVRPIFDATRHATTAIPARGMHQDPRPGTRPVPAIRPVSGAHTERHFLVSVGNPKRLRRTRTRLHRASRRSGPDRFRPGRPPDPVAFSPSVSDRALPALHGFPREGAPAVPPPEFVASPFRVSPRSMLIEKRLAQSRRPRVPGGRLYPLALRDRGRELPLPDRDSGEGNRSRRLSGRGPEHN